MALVISAKNERTIDVTAKEPIGGGKYASHTFTATFEITDPVEWAEYFAEKEGEPPALMIDMVMDKLVDLDSRDDSGGRMVFDTTVKNAIRKNMPWTHEPLWHALLTVQQGLTPDDFERKRKEALKKT